MSNYKPKATHKSSLAYKLRDCEKSIITLELERSLGNFSKAAFNLGVSRTTLFRKLRTLGIDVKEFRHPVGCRCGQCKPQARTKKLSPELPQCACCKGEGAQKPILLVDGQGIVDTEPLMVCQICYVKYAHKTPGFVDVPNTQKETT